MPDLDNAILQHILRTGTWGAKRATINVIFGRNASKAEIADAVARLAAAGCIERIEGTPLRAYPVRSFAGRKPETWIVSEVLK